MTRIESKALIQKFRADVTSLTNEERLALIAFYRGSQVYAKHFIYIDIQLPRFVPMSLLHTVEELNGLRSTGLNLLVTDFFGVDYIADLLGKQYLTKQPEYLDKLFTHRNPYFHNYVQTNGRDIDGLLLLANMQLGDQFRLCPRGERRYTVSALTATTITFAIQTTGSADTTLKIQFKSLFPAMYSKRPSMHDNFVRLLEDIYCMEARMHGERFNELGEGLHTIYGRELTSREAVPA